ncbi:MAG TPA: methionyl-tRNA formyltransferase [Gemmatimonadales bacterium]|jgi:methionyl-tRNA formyltransferase|nr:methionyl-tRNA formyltransferase [Gemmatimonadales bacterium]
MRVLFLGSKRLGLRVLQTIVATRPESLVGVVTLRDDDDSRSVRPDFQRFCAEHRLTLHEVSRRSEADQVLVETSPDLCIVVGWYWLIGEEMRSRVPGGFVGIHNSLLPRYRGGAPLVWSLIRGDAEVGASIFTLSDGVDSGPIWAAVRVQVEPQEGIGSVLARLEDGVVATFRELYPRLLDGQASAQAQDVTAATYCCQRRPEDGQIDWSWPAAAIHNFIRAQSEPYPGAFTMLGSRPLHIWRAEPTSEVWLGVPGQVARIIDDTVLVVCGDSRCLALRVVSQDGIRSAASQLIRSVRARFPQHPVYLERLDTMAPSHDTPAESSAHGRS